MFFGFLYAYEHYERFMHVNILVVFLFDLYYFMGVRDHKLDDDTHAFTTEIRMTYEDTI